MLSVGVLLLGHWVLHWSLEGSGAVVLLDGVAHGEGVADHVVDGGRHVSVVEEVLRSRGRFKLFHLI